MTPEHVARVDRGVALLRIQPAEIRHIRTAPTFEEAVARLDAWKADVRGRVRRLAFELHPDRNGGDAARVEDLVAVNAAWDAVRSFTVSRPPPRPSITMWSNSAYGSASTGTTSSAYVRWVRV